MAIRRGAPPRPPGSTSRTSGRGKATASTPQGPSASPDVFQEGGPEPQDAARLPRAAPMGGEAAAARAEIQTRADIAKLERELGRLLELFAAADTEARLWDRLLEHRARLEGARRRLNRVRRRRLELSARWGDAPPTPETEALSISLARLSSDGERFEAISARLSALLDEPETQRGPTVAQRRRSGRSTRDVSIASPSELLSELAMAMIELLRHAEPEA